MPASMRLDGAEIDPRSAEAAVDAGIAHRLSGGQSAAESDGGAKTSFSAASRRGSAWSATARDAPARRARCLRNSASTSTSPRRSDSYSVAVQQIVAIARAVDLSAQVLILDEPTASLDRAGGRDPFRVMRELARRGHRHRLHHAFPRPGLRDLRPHHGAAQRQARSASATTAELPRHRIDPR